MSAQLEDGYTRIANELLEQIPKYKFNGTQLRIILTVWRYTYGFNRKDHEMSLSFFVKATQLGKTQIDRELTVLIDSNVLVVTEEPTYTKSRKLGFNKNYDEWLIEYSQPKQEQSAKTLTVSKKDTEQSAKTLTQTVSKNADQEIHSFKDSKESSTTDDFDKVVSAFRRIHRNVLDFLTLDSPLLTGMLEDGIPADFIIEIMESKYKPSVKVFNYYKDAIREQYAKRPKFKRNEELDRAIELQKRMENYSGEPEQWILDLLDTGS